MSSDEIAIRVEHLSKCYQIYDQPGDRLKQFIAPRFQRWMGREPRNFYNEFWALRDVSFEVRRGDTVGIIGRNGSGKSTLLQAICGTLTPTAGRVEVHGRVAALLELGAGFNPEFSGRDNVYMNAALLGLNSEQVDQRFDAIAAFADIGSFIEQPVKTYSSGMYIRLAFSVIAHVDADVLIIDEALSVGDAVFTQKCMRFIRSFQEKGTLLFVSHDMGSVQNLCRTSLWMSHGQIMQSGSSQRVVEAYLRSTLQDVYGNATDLQELNTDSSASASNEGSSVNASAAEVAPPVVDYEASVRIEHSNLEQARGWKTGGAEITAVELKRADGEDVALLEGGERVQVTIRAVAHQDLDRPILGFLLKDRLGQDLIGENTLPLTATSPRSMKAGQVCTARFTFRLPMLPNGAYALMASVADGTLESNVQHHYMHDALILNVASSKVRWGLVGVPFESIDFEVTHG
ncbi:ABC transporter ATP-binding protein [Acidovorax sp. FG27]|uniref:ABC transporter ATP-binding protein n=1 Tax=Acidovorax sp. FG27 TaxID=3133652 RepID=UPI0030EA2E4E